MNLGPHPSVPILGPVSVETRLGGPDRGWPRRRVTQVDGTDRTTTRCGVLVPGTPAVHLFRVKVG